MLQFIILKKSRLIFAKVKKSVTFYSFLLASTIKKIKIFSGNFQLNVQTLILNQIADMNCHFVQLMVNIKFGASLVAQIVDKMELFHIKVASFNTTFSPILHYQDMMLQIFVEFDDGFGFVDLKLLQHDFLMQLKCV